MADFSTRRTSKERCCAATIAPAAANSDERAAVSLAAGGVIAAAGTWTCGVREGNAAWMAAEAVANALVASVHELAVFRSPACAEGVFDSKWGSLLGGASGMTSRARQRACIDRVAVPAGGSGFARALIPIDVCYPGRSLPGHGNPFRPLPPPPEAPSALRKPAWLKVPLPGGPDHGRLKTLTRKLGLYTVCEEARCPNIGECWKGEHATMTLMVLGDECTRACRFCAVKTVKQAAAPDPLEPARTSGRRSRPWACATS